MKNKIITTLTVLMIVTSSFGQGIVEDRNIRYTGTNTFDIPVHIGDTILSSTNGTLSVSEVGSTNPPVNTMSVAGGTFTGPITVLQINNPYSTNSYWRWNSATQLVIRLDIGDGTNIFIDGRE